MLCSDAALSGNLDILKWARAQIPPCDWDAAVCQDAAFQGRTEVLKWARSQEPPCEWNDGTMVCVNAAKNGFLETLQVCMVMCRCVYVCVCVCLSI